MNTDKAYLLGLIIGGGIFGNAEDVFRIRLPYNKWGAYLANPQRAGKISEDIICKVGQMFRAIYNLSVQYETTPKGTWIILCEGDLTLVKNDFMHFGIICEGELRGNVDISLITKELIDDNLKRRFVAGLADTIGSMAKSQRRFTAEHQIISFEIKGYNFKFVCELCRLLYSINCIPDQVNWNHPNIHCTNDSFYSQWNKGFKLRILLDQYANFGAFAFKTKAETLNENRKLQSNVHFAEQCETRDMHFTPSSVHPAENDERLPEIIRGGHYIHFRHFCAVIGCEHAPFDKIKEQFSNIGELINPFPILHKDSYENIDNIVKSSDILLNQKYRIITLKVSTLLTMYIKNSTTLLYGKTADNGYPITEILKAVAYVIAYEDELSGKRTKGYIKVIEKHINKNPDISIEIRKPELLTPLIVIGNNRGALIGPKNPNVYRRLVSFSPENEYKLMIRKITTQDLQDGEG